ncbi:EF-hand domain-containing family member B isoform X2 [Dendrobates tinctorius]|uniref:EF-hand domain-containing family member B isoform X2 n=1 Tax=Dendrobates tinctorius TaxID=92724 RepID=UPI003CC9B0FB
MAGKLFPTGERASSCLAEVNNRPPTPPVVLKFLNSRRPNPGVPTVLYGKANDPRKENDIIHGVSTRPSLSAGSLINVPLKTLFQQKLLEKKESIYASATRTPLGKSYDQAAAFPANINFNETTFGRMYQRSSSAGVLINPTKSFQEVEEESHRGHDLYVVTHNDFDVGEIRNRKYDWTKYKKGNRFGISTPHFNDGRNVARSLRWLQEMKMKEEANIVSKRVDDFRERSQYQLGKALDPIADTMKVPADHTFGMICQPEAYGVGDLLHYRASKDFLRGKEKQRAVLAAVQQHLKKANHHCFTSLLDGFRHYDKNSDGKIDKDDLKKTCEQFGLYLEPVLLDSLIEYCDVDKDGLINFVEFANFLNWKDKLSIGKQVSLEGHLKPEDLILEEGASEKSLRTLSKGNQTPKFNQTSSSRINATIGGPLSSCFQTHGIPSIRTDLAPPRFRRISDRTNYGDESNAFGLLCPSIFTQHMVYERDIFKSRTKEEMAQILHTIGVNMPDNIFEELWKLAEKRHPKGEVSVETMRSVLEDLQSNTKLYSIA